MRQKWILYNKAPFTTFLLPLYPHKLRKLVKVRRTAQFLSRDLRDPTFEAKLVIYSTHESKVFESFIRFQTSLTQSLETQSLLILLIWAGGRSDQGSTSSHFIGTFFELTAAHKTARHKSNSTRRWKTCGCTPLPTTLHFFLSWKSNQSGKTAEFQAIWQASTFVILFCA